MPNDARGTEELKHSKQGDMMLFSCDGFGVSDKEARDASYANERWNLDDLFSRHRQCSSLLHQIPAQGFGRSLCSFCCSPIHKAFRVR